MMADGVDPDGQLAPGRLLPTHRRGQDQVDPVAGAGQPVQGVHDQAAQRLVTSTGQGVVQQMFGLVDAR